MTNTRNKVIKVTVVHNQTLDGKPPLFCHKTNGK